jgi:hypothetical protein
MAMFFLAIELSIIAYLPIGLRLIYIGKKENSRIKTRSGVHAIIFTIIAAPTFWIIYLRYIRWLMDSFLILF